MPDCHCDLGKMRGKACHCRACCLTFTGPSAFDHHIVRGVHALPGLRGLIRVRPEAWGWPSSETPWFPATLEA
jgi:hypothetical protein